MMPLPLPDFVNDTTKPAVHKRWTLKQRRLLKKCFYACLNDDAIAERLQKLRPGVTATHVMHKRCAEGLRRRHTSKGPPTKKRGATVGQALADFPTELPATRPAKGYTVTIEGPGFRVSGSIPKQDACTIAATVLEKQS